MDLSSMFQPIETDVVVLIILEDPMERARKIWKREENDYWNAFISLRY